MHGIDALAGTLMDVAVEKEGVLVVKYDNSTNKSMQSDWLLCCATNLNFEFNLKFKLFLLLLLSNMTMVSIPNFAVYK